MARNGTPDDSGDYPANEPTRYAEYGGTAAEAYSEYGPPTSYGQYGAPVATTPLPPVPTPWHQRPVVLVGFGVLTAVVLTLLVYAVVKFTTAGNSHSPTVTSGSVTPSTERAPAGPTVPQPGPTVGTAEQDRTAEQPAPSSAPQPLTPTEVTPSATVAPTPSATVSPSVTTVTETTTKRLFPTFPRPNRPAEEVPAGG